MIDINILHYLKVIYLLPCRRLNGITTVKTILGFLRWRRPDIRQADYITRKSQKPW